MIGPTWLIWYMSHCIVVARPRASFGRRRPVFSARWTRMAPDSNTERGPPGTSWSTIAGIFWFGLIAVKGGRELLLFLQVHRDYLVGQTELLERDRDLPAVRRRPRVEVDHLQDPPAARLRVAAAHAIRGVGSADAVELLVHVPEHAGRVEARLRLAVVGLVVDAPEALGRVVVAGDEGLDAAKLVRLLLELGRPVDALVAVRHPVHGEIDVQVPRPRPVRFREPRVRLRHAVGHDPEREVAELTQVPGVELRHAPRRDEVVADDVGPALQAEDGRQAAGPANHVGGAEEEPAEQEADRLPFERRDRAAQPVRLGV